MNGPKIPKLATGSLDQSRPKSVVEAFQDPLRLHGHPIDDQFLQKAAKTVRIDLLPRRCWDRHLAAIHMNPTFMA
jgi:hypothetical protein